ncbi:type II secretion system protein N [Uliginosibacterium sp. H1]|uniref:type II secretion system protein N n=1 Tax=Uliginosibacterium sp. H1 TaxID=3114757 RepID=UPI002E176A12|nr:type II secretion system protein N [Uliginosibacterium sp. H1]
MFASRLNRLDRLAPLASVLAWAAALALTAWLGAHWYWRLAAPPVETARHTPLVEPLAAAQEIASRHLFGMPAADSAPVAAAPGALASRFKVLGLMAHSSDRQPGFAILQESGQPAVSAVEGREFAPGLKVVRVTADSVEITQGGSREVLRYAPAGAATPPTGLSSPGNSPVPPPGVPATVAPTQPMMVAPPQTQTVPSGVVPPPPPPAANRAANAPGNPPPPDEQRND